MESRTPEAKSILEAALLCATQAMSIREMQILLGESFGADDVRGVLLELQQDWQGRGLELIQVSSGWRFQTRAALRTHLERLHPERPQRYSRAAMETLAVIAYRQPVTRGDIEDIRGVVVSSQIVRQLEERGWIESIGHREVLGRPALYATTRQFLEDLGLMSLADLPALDAFTQTEMAPEQASLLSESAAVAGSLDESEQRRGGPPTGSSEDLVATQDATSDQSATEQVARNGAESFHAAPLSQEDLEASAP